MTFVYIAVGLIIIMVIIGALRGGTSVEPPPANLTDEDIHATALQGKKIQAIKWYRQLHNVGLKEAKDAVEAMLK